MNVKNIDIAKKLIEKLDSTENIIVLLKNDWIEEVVYVRSRTSRSYALTPNMRHALLDIAREEKESIIKQIEAL